MKYLILVLVVLNIALIASPQVKDKDGNNYKTVKIGTQKWMAENLNVSHFNNGDIIPEVKTDEEWKKASDNHEPAWCYFNNDPGMGPVYGKLYNWYAISDSRGIVPKGWHIPIDTEWATMVNYLGGESVAADKIKSNSGWVKDCNGNNSSGFTGLPIGRRDDDGLFGKNNSNAAWWTLSQNVDVNSWVYGLICIFHSVKKYFYGNGSGASVRCVQD